MKSSTHTSAASAAVFFGDVGVLNRRSTVEVISASQSVV
jgi:hypothetical protein